MALDLCSLAQALHQLGAWKTNRGGTPARSVQNRLSQFPPVDENDSLLPPMPTLLYYELLRGIGVIRCEDGEGRPHQAAQIFPACR